MDRTVRRRSETDRPDPPLRPDDRRLAGPQPRRRRLSRTSSSPCPRRAWPTPRSPRYTDLAEQPAHHRDHVQPGRRRRPGVHRAEEHQRHTTLDLTGVRLAGGVDFTFPGVSLAAGPDAWSSPAMWRSSHAHYGSGHQRGRRSTAAALNDGGDELVLQLPAPYDAAILRFDYNDAWYPATDGGGYALTIVDPAIDPADYGTTRPVGRPARCWAARPAAADGETLAADVVINEVLSHTDLPQLDSIELRNVSAAPVNISGWYLSDSRDHLTKFRIPGVVGQPSEIILQPGQYIVFDEDDFNPGGGRSARESSQRFRPGRGQGRRRVARAGRRRGQRDRHGRLRAVRRRTERRLVRPRAKHRGTVVLLPAAERDPRRRQQRPARQPRGHQRGAVQPGQHARGRRLGVRRVAEHHRPSRST